MQTHFERAGIGARIVLQEVVRLPRVPHGDGGSRVVQDRGDYPRLQKVQEGLPQERPGRVRRVRRILPQVRPPSLILLNSIDAIITT